MRTYPHNWHRLHSAGLCALNKAERAKRRTHVAYGLLVLGLLVGAWSYVGSEPESAADSCARLHRGHFDTASQVCHLPNFKRIKP